MGQIIQLNAKRGWQQRTYDAYPQTGNETIDGHPILMNLEQIVEGVIDGDANCLEWLGYPINNASPLAIPLPLETEAECSCCGKIKHLDAFYRDPRKVNGRRSECKTCHIENMKLQYHHGKLRKWGRAA